MIIAILLSIAVPAAPDTVVLTLDAAVSRAVSHNPTLRAERAAARAAAQMTGDATRAFLPSVRAEAQAIRTTDPVAVFGLKLRQGTFAGADLALDALNAPAAFGGFTTQAVAEVPLVAPEGLFGYAAARRAADAAAAGAERAGGGTALLVTVAYRDAQLAGARLTALDTALAAARAHVRQAEALHAQGMVTGLDARLAALQAADLEVRHLAAEAEALNAHSRLRAHLALSEDTPLVLSDALTAERPSQCDPGAACAVEDRGDLRAAVAAAAAADLGRRSAWAARFPRLGAFAAVSYHGHDAPWGDGSGDWTLGLAIRWDLFPALGGVAAVRRASADREAAHARLEATRRQAAVEVLEAERRLGAARAGAAVAERAEREAQVTLDQAQARYRSGAAPITELLDVQAAATNATLTFLAARRDLLIAQAALEFAYGVHDR